MQISKESQDPWNKNGDKFPGSYFCLTYPRLGAEEDGNLETSMGTYQKKPPKEPAFSSQSSRKGSLAR